MTLAARVSLLVAATVLAVPLVAERLADALPPRTLAGRLLVATESMGDRRFTRTVIYLVRHDPAGALGVIVNVPIAEVPFDRLLRMYGLQALPGSGQVRVHYGGPVDETSAHVVHTPEWTGETTIAVDGGFAVTADPGVLQAMARGAGPRRALVCLGRAGWAPGQLDAELETGAWAVASTDERLLFDEDPKQKWIEAMARRILKL
jgi:putative transcriptional regulator